MFWGKKDDKQLPDLPPMKPGLQGKTPLPASPSAMPGMPENEESDDTSPTEKHGLPSFPDSPMTKGFSQAAIKDAIVNDSVKDAEIVGVAQEPKSFKVVEVDDESPLASSPILASRASVKNTSLLPPPREETLPEPVPEPRPIIVEPVSQPAPYPSSSRSSDVFVKIDKFHSARRALSMVQNQLESVDSLLKKIRETKMREEQEFSAWEKDMVQAKSRIDEISKALFEKVD
ncbi:MAG: hypothetical protein FJY98_01615 [Candidatus Liptonbacteria bacterium]|nr:hypothetical protein [Candidatus Pacearchaeota archaeon]MBM3257006.1 hypothetical protein [Candidatus Liptonbacteria bacterium]